MRWLRVMDPSLTGWQRREEGEGAVDVMEPMAVVEVVDVVGVR